MKTVYLMILIPGLLLADSSPSVLLRKAEVARRGYEGTTREVLIYSNDTVSRASCKGAPRVCENKQVHTLTRQERTQIEKLLDEASLVKSEHIPKTLRCKMRPAKYTSYTGRNGKLVLSRGHGCIGWTKNPSKAAKELIAILNHYQR